MTKMPLTTYEELHRRIGELEAQLADTKNQFKIQIEATRQEERERVMAAFKDAYPAIDTWPCWKALIEKEGLERLL